MSSWPPDGNEIPEKTTKKGHRVQWWNERELSDSIAALQFPAAGGDHTMTARMTFLSLTVLSLMTLRASPAISGGNQPYLVKDIRPGWMGSGPTSMHKIGDRLFFNANDGDHGQELWVSDGTEQGTYMVLDLVPGSDGSVPQWFMEDLQGAAIFQADNNDDGLDVYRSDGTAPGTTWVGEVNDGDDPIPNGTCTFSFYYFEMMGDAVYFIGKNPTNQEALWKTNGTPAGTVKLKDVNINEFEAVGSTLFFVGSATGQTIPGFDLWKSDGTVAGTIRLKDLAGAIFLTESNGKIFFQGEGTGGDEELWVSNGTPEGTLLVNDINPGPNPSSPLEMTNVGGILYFTAFSPSYGREIWRSDGTEVGTQLLFELVLGPTSGGAFELTSADGFLYFARFDAAVGYELWRSDGTHNGTQLVKVIGPANLPFDERPEFFTPANGKLYFSGSDGVHGKELWVSDGTSLGTLMLDDANPGPGSLYPVNLVSMNDLIFFAGGNQAAGAELWAVETRQAVIPAVSGVGAVAFFGLLLCAGYYLAKYRINRENTLGDPRRIRK